MPKSAGQAVADRSAKRPLHIGVVGLGYWGPNLARNIADLPDAEVAWLCDARTDRV
jgi:predicted dehydrogenase